MQTVYFSFSQTHKKDPYFGLISVSRPCSLSHHLYIDMLFVLQMLLSERHINSAYIESISFSITPNDPAGRTHAHVPAPSVPLSGGGTALLVVKVCVSEGEPSPAALTAWIRKL